MPQIRVSKYKKGRSGKSIPEGIQDIANGVRYTYTKAASPHGKLLVLTSFGNGVDVSTMASAISDMSRPWDGKKTKKAKMYRIIQLFELDEFSFSKEGDIETVFDIGRTFLESAYSEFPGMVVTLIDPVSGCLYNHILVSAMSLSGERLELDQLSGSYLKYKFDEILEPYGLHTWNEWGLTKADINLQHVLKYLL